MKETRELRKSHHAGNSSMVRNAVKAVRLDTVKIFVTHVVRKKPQNNFSETLAKKLKARTVSNKGELSPPNTN